MTLMTFDKQSNGRRIEVEPPHKCTLAEMRAGGAPATSRDRQSTHERCLLVICTPPNPVRQQSCAGTRGRRWIWRAVLP